LPNEQKLGSVTKMPMDTCIRTRKIIKGSVAVSEEKIFLEIIQSETRIVYGGHIC
jgi:hypothetical protein